MNYRILTASVLAAVAFAACAEGERDETPAPARGAARVTLLGEGTEAVSVYAFRRQGDVFLYDTLFRDGWTADGRLSVRMSGGSYKFLFAAGENENISLQPALRRGVTTWDEAAFTLRENPATPGVCLPAGELFLQFPAAEAERVYTLRGTDQTISARLTRAVCRIGVTLKRGYFDGEKYVVVPYADPRTILDQIERIELTAEGTGLRVRPDGSGGTASVAASLAAADYAELTDDGFVALDGPLVIPPADGAQIGLDLRVVPAAGSALQATRLHLSGTAERNKRLEITLWITSDYPVIGVEIVTAPIEREQDGDSGIWE